MAKNKTEPQINLLPQEEFESSTLGRVVKWLLGTFRYIVIATEMIVMVSFLSRFWLDARSGALIDEITQKTAVISSYATFEKDFRAAQAKIKIFETFATSPKTSSTIEAISTKIPSDVTLTEITLDGQKVEIRGTTTSENSAAIFVANLNTSEALTNMAIIAVETKNQDLIFTVKGTTKGALANGN